MNTNLQESTVLDLTINEILARFPNAFPIIHKYGIDACCGGQLTVREVATRHGIDVRQLLADLAPLGWG